MRSKTVKGNDRRNTTKGNSVVGPKKKEVVNIITPTMANTRKNNFDQHRALPDCCVKGDGNGCDCAICSWDPRTAYKEYEMAKN